MIDTRPQSLATNTQRVTLDTHAIAYRTAGAATGAPVILLHGLLDTSATFANLVSALVAQRGPGDRFVAPDWRGHGESEWTPGDYHFPNYLADLDALLDALCPNETVTLIGHSMGGQVASLYAGARPSRVACLILLDSINVPDADTAQAPDRYAEWLDTRRAPPAPKTYADIPAFTARLARRYPELSAEQQAHLARLWSTPTDDGRIRLRADPAHMKKNAQGFRAAEAKAVWQAVVAPTLLIDGGASPAGALVQPAEMAERRACFTHRRHVVLDGLGHMIHWQAPEAVAEHIAAFMTALGDSPGGVSEV
ncbi:alpha/beta fold hydrolase [Salinisphaera sp. Q1T1-3]|uniref:alpha/beta fold hydrolase n=1 Tax=Salinisphaera sp. Q1T1-3 TaxID=2321229 RepID=UPI000E763C7C|nr:alpha/beta hydrolase [Salinisphaera sp. Q1T1-3]RJS94377.1 alpha/beta hydrolase [Salinisphaera sp. Q1T1-3]